MTPTKRNSKRSSADVVSSAAQGHGAASGRMGQRSRQTAAGEEVPGRAEGTVNNVPRRNTIVYGDR